MMRFSMRQDGWASGHPGPTASANQVRSIE
jgi:hypothetical protein